MHLDRAVSLLCETTLGRLGLLGREQATPVLMYHSVSNDVDQRVHPYFRLATSPTRFREHMKALADGGYVVKDLTEAAREESSASVSARSVILTFDDGFADFLANAWPVLQEFGFTATMFVPTAFIGDERRRFMGRECLTWTEVRDLARCGVSFGSHTVSHQTLHLLPWSEIRRDLQESREEIERRLGAPVTAFAYPSAFPQQDEPFVARFCEELRQQDYRASVTTMIGRLRPGDDPLRIKRLPVSDADDRRLLTAKLAGAYDWLGPFQAAWKRMRPQTKRPPSMSVAG